MGPITASTIGGFISGICTLSGVVLAYRLSERRVRQETLTEARRSGMAVLIELIHNADLAINGAETGLIHEFSNDAWLQQLQGLARLFDWGTLRFIESAYEAARRLYDSCHADRRANLEDKARRAACAVVAEDLLQAARGICSGVLNETEQIAFKSDIDTLLKRAQAAHAVNG